MTSVANTWRTALDILLPPSCPGCDMPVAIQDTLCAACFGATVFVTDPACLCCGLPFGSARRSGTQGACAVCAADPPPWRRARAALMYEALGRALVLKLKHADRQDVASVLALHMSRAGRALLAEADMLVPVPLHRWRLLRRGFNQSALLAQALGRTSFVPTVLDAVRRIRRTPALGPLAAADRRRALEGAFVIPARRLAQIRGRHILLIDDVMTSGATAASCTRSLLDAGARHVDVLVASRVADPRGQI
jgi:ComF family protein